jgi:hypothetical protein
MTSKKRYYGSNAGRLASPDPVFFQAGLQEPAKEKLNLK